jgi:hypothetical protein
MSLKSINVDWRIGSSGKISCLASVSPWVHKPSATKNKNKQTKNPNGLIFPFILLKS